MQIDTPLPLLSPIEAPGDLKHVPLVSDIVSSRLAYYYINGSTNTIDPSIFSDWVHGWEYDIVVTS